MTYYFEILGTDNFHDHFSNSDNKLSGYTDYIKNNVGSEIEEVDEENAYYYTHHESSYKVEVNSCETFGTCFGETNLRVRRDEADDWLQDNFAYYDLASVCVVFDYYENMWGSVAGTAHQDGFNDSEEKVALTNVSKTEGSASGTEWVSGHEIGHVAGGLHQHVRYDSDEYDFDCEDPYPMATYMHSPETDDSCNQTCSFNSSRAPSEYRSVFSWCAKNRIGSIE